MKLRKYKKLRRNGRTMSGLYKTAKEEGHSDAVIADMLFKVLPCGRHSEYTNNRKTLQEIQTFMRGEDECLTCGKTFKLADITSWEVNCPSCEDRIGKLWDGLNAHLKEHGCEELDEETMTTAGLMIMMRAAITADK